MTYVRPGNGAGRPGRWTPEFHDYKATTGLREGDLVAWRYGAWRVIEVRPFDAANLSDEQVKAVEEHVKVWRPEVREERRAAYWPGAAVIAHERGPRLDKGHAKRHDDGRYVLHLPTGEGRTFNLLPEPYRVCSCHGDPWPCQEIDQAELAAAAAERMDKLMATAAPGVCAHCLEPITARQKTLTFPEESRLVPGAPGPTFHAGRAACWHRAVEYERTGRLADNPDVVRLASCPGVQFIHEARDLPAERRLDCTAGPHCTGLHGPPGYKHAEPCYFKTVFAVETNGKDVYPRPTFDCGYRRPGEPVGCLGRVVAGDDFSTALNERAGDVLADPSRRGGMWGTIYSDDGGDDG